MSTQQLFYTNYQPSWGKFFISHVLSAMISIGGYFNSSPFFTAAGFVPAILYNGSNLYESHKQKQAFIEKNTIDSISFQDGKPVAVEETPCFPESPSDKFTTSLLVSELLGVYLVYSAQNTTTTTMLQHIFGMATFITGLEYFFSSNKVKVEYSGDVTDYDPNNPEQLKLLNEYMESNV